MIFFQIVVLMTVAWNMAESRGGDRSLVFNAGRLDVDPPRVAECCDTVDGVTSICPRR
jgi:hypothetical protein